MSAQSRPGSAHHPRLPASLLSMTPCASVVSPSRRAAEQPPLRQRAPVRTAHIADSTARNARNSGAEHRAGEMERKRRAASQIGQRLRPPGCAVRRGLGLRRSPARLNIDRHISRHSTLRCLGHRCLRAWVCPAVRCQGVKSEQGLAAPSGISHCPRSFPRPCTCLQNGVRLRHRTKRQRRRRAKASAALIPRFPCLALRSLCAPHSRRAHRTLHSHANRIARGSVIHERSSGGGGGCGCVSVSARPSWPRESPPHMLPQLRATVFACLSSF